MSQKRILITGAAGFLGSHLSDRFIREGYEKYRALNDE
jgi:dTDP-glucose 4,6-dehydratase